MRQWIIVSALFAAYAATAGCKEQTQAREPVRPVMSTLVEPMQSGNTNATGTVEPRYKTDLSFRVEGRLIARPVNIGDLVEEGQTVAAIDPATLELDLHSAFADVSKNQAHLTNAIAKEERQRKLITTYATTKATLENVEQARAAAQALMVRAQANLTKAHEELGYAQLKSDFAGVVTAVGGEVGQVVSPGQSVVTVARPDIREAVVDIGADFPVPLRTGLPFTVNLQLNPTTHVEGQVREIGPQADSATRTRRVRITLNNPPDTFRLGATVTATATVNGGQNSILRVPASAILTKDDETFVWIVDPSASTVSLHKIAIARDEGGIRVTGGLSAGARVVTAGIHSLKEGQQVRIEQEATP
jgi:RND family efflux transporter MFP subunit